jgi:hypothetical protein
VVVCFEAFAKFRACNRAASFYPALLHYTDHYYYYTHTLFAPLEGENYSIHETCNSRRS